MGERYPIKSESRKSRKSRKILARYFGRISQSREIQKVRDFPNSTGCLFDFVYFDISKIVNP